jgi:multimeric flavodoxin WrbA
MQHQLTIIGINGSPRKANTDLLLTEALSAAQRAGNIKTEKINLREENIEYCIGCLKCNNPNDYPSGCHVHRDAMDTLTAKLISCHGLILASPVYFGGVTAQMKTFMDRTEPLLRYAPVPRRSALRNKVAAGISVGGNRNGGQETTIQSLHHFFMIHDMVVVGTGPEPQPGCYLGAAAFSGAHPQLGSLVKNAVETDPIGIRAAGIIGRRVAEMVSWLNRSPRGTPIQ